MRIAIGADHAGFELKTLLAKHLSDLGHEVVNLGTDSDHPVDYPDYAEAVALAVREGQAVRGVVVCGSGVGASVAANKVPGIRAGLCHDAYSAHQGVEHDDVNVLVMGSRVIGRAVALEILESFLGAKFSDEERHSRRLEKVRAIERRFGKTFEAPMGFALTEELQARVEAQLAQWEKAGTIERVWARDASVWTRHGEEAWLGWLRATDDATALIDELKGFGRELRRDGIEQLLLLGMGGSSLCPDVLARSFGNIPGQPVLRVLDSTDPAQLRSAEADIDFARTLIVVASKSGTTLEPAVFMEYFLARARDAIGEAAGRHFVAITDPGSQLESRAESEGFRRIFRGEPSIGGRYSALSPFGLVPAALMGLDVGRLVEGAKQMARACAPPEPLQRNPGAVLGAVLGHAAEMGRDKLTLVLSPAVEALGAWLEQLVAESTGKHGRGIIPVVGEKLAEPDSYGNDRVFVYTRVRTLFNRKLDAAVDRLAEFGHPVIRLEVDGPYDLGAEFFRWEFATALAGAVLGINPFDQPDVEASKRATRALTEEYERTGDLPTELPVLEADGLQVFAGADTAKHLAASSDGTLTGHLRAHLATLQAGDYFALLAYLEMTRGHDQQLQRIRQLVRDSKRVATCVGFGPRFLHSTGQAYKGGPASGVFIQITCRDANDLAIPGRSYSFGTVKAAQALGDLSVLVERGRRALRVHIDGDVTSGLETLALSVETALGPLPG